MDADRPGAARRPLTDEGPEVGEVADTPVAGRAHRGELRRRSPDAPVPRDGVWLIGRVGADDEERPRQSFVAVQKLDVVIPGFGACRQQDTAQRIRRAAAAMSLEHLQILRPEAAFFSAPLSSCSRHRRCLASSVAGNRTSIVPGSREARCTSTGGSTSRQRLSSCPVIAWATSESVAAGTPIAASTRRNVRSGTACGVPPRSGNVV